MNNKLKIAVLCQNDSFAIPNNIKLLNDIKDIELVSIVNIKHKGSIENKKILFLKGFGIFQTAKLGILIAINKFLDFIDMVSGYNFGLHKSLKAISNFINSDYLEIDNPNNQHFHKWIKRNNIDLIVSFSAPCIFNIDLLEIPKYGCINLHCSLLPKYPGQLPSFWTLFNEEKEIGATVHYMDSKIDNGKILGQVKVELPSPLTMFSVINATKNAGGMLMVNVIQDMIGGNLIEKDNHIAKNGYYRWPTIDQIRQFRFKGGRLV